MTSPNLSLILSIFAAAPHNHEDVQKENRKEGRKHSRVLVKIRQHLHRVHDIQAVRRNQKRAPERRQMCCFAFYQSTAGVCARRGSFGSVQSYLFVVIKTRGRVNNCVNFLKNFLLRLFRKFSHNNWKKAISRFNNQNFWIYRGLRSLLILELLEKSW